MQYHAPTCPTYLNGFPLHPSESRPKREKHRGEVLWSLPKFIPRISLDHIHQGFPDHRSSDRLHRHTTAAFLHPLHDMLEPRVYRYLQLKSAMKSSRNEPIGTSFLLSRATSRHAQCGIAAIATSMKVESPMVIH